MAYLDVPIDTDPQDVAQDAYDFLSAVIPGWSPNVSSLDVWIIQAMATAAAESRDVASRVPTSIFRWFGAYLVGVQPIDAASASVTARFTMKDNAGYTVPANTVIGITSTGTDQEAFQTLADVVIPPGSTFADIAVVAVTPGAAGSGLGAVGQAATLLVPLDFVTTVVLQGITSGGVDDEDDGAYLNRLAAQLTLLAPRPILPADFAIFARNIAGVYRATAIDGYNPFHNWLTANEASAETDASGWGTTVNCNLASTAAQAADGAKSVSLTSIAAGDMAASSPVANSGASAKPVSPGETVTGLVSIRSAASVRSCRAELRWHDATGTVLSTTQGAAANDSTTAWTAYSVTGVAPANAAYVKVRAYIIATGAANEVHYVDKASLRQGNTTDWVAGGTAETGNPRTVAIAAVDQLGAAASAPVKAAVQADLNARREVNFVINTVDPTISPIDVTYQVVAKAGYDKPTVLASINAALRAYASPALWGADTDDPQTWNNITTLRYLEVAAVINNVDGVDYITTTGGNYDLTIALHGSTMARQDIVLPGPAPLPNAAGGTLTGTVL